MAKKLLMGNEAMAHAALEAGVGVVAGYPGTPSSEIVETIARQYNRGAAHGIHVEWSTNEKVALELLFGASLAGKRGLFTCKQMGLNVASDALMALNYVSVRAGLVLIVADDPGPISSQTEQDTRRFAAFAKVPVLDPSSPEQAFSMVKAAFDLSERFHTPVIVRPTTRVDHASAFIDVEEETTARTSIAGAIAPADKERANDPAVTQALSTGFVRNANKWVIFPRRAYEAHGEINERLVGIAHVFATNSMFSQFNQIDEIAAAPDPRGQRAHARPGVQLVEPSVAFGIMTSGISTAYTREALRIVAKHAAEAGIRMPGYRFMQIGTPFPFPEAAVAKFTKGLADILVIEELDYVLEDELTRFAGRMHAPYNVHGKLTGEARDHGENDIDDIVVRIERFLGLTGRLSLFRLRDETTGSTFGDPGSAPSVVELSDEAAAELPDRPPVLCAGCPHRASFYAVKVALGDVPAVMCGDIGCYTLGNATPLEMVDTCLCMGGGITMAQGISVSDPDKKAIAYIGDSTFFASGMTGLTNAVYNKHDITVIVLDNSTTAMTGLQPHPGTGATLMGSFSEPVSAEAVLVSCGVTHVYRANPLDRDASIVAVRAALSFEGPSAVIFESPCAQLVPPDPPVLVNTETCTGCKRCITSIGCPAISFNANVNGPRSRSRGQAVIDRSLCVGCNLCVQVCPFRAILPGEVVAKLEAEPSWPPYLSSAMPLSDEEMVGRVSVGQSVLAGMRESWEPTEATSALAPSGKVGPFKSYPSFENPWESGRTEALSPVDEQLPASNQIVYSSNDREGASTGSESEIPIPYLDQDDVPADPDDSSHIASAEDDTNPAAPTQIPDFGVAAEFEEEIEAELAQQTRSKAQRTRKNASQLSLGFAFDSDEQSDSEE